MVIVVHNFAGQSSFSFAYYASSDAQPRPVCRYNYDNGRHLIKSRLSFYRTPTVGNSNLVSFSTFYACAQSNFSSSTVQPAVLYATHIGYVII